MQDIALRYNCILNTLNPFCVGTCTAYTERIFLLKGMVKMIFNEDLKPGYSMAIGYHNPDLKRSVIIDCEKFALRTNTAEVFFNKFDEEIKQISNIVINGIEFVRKDER